MSVRANRAASKRRGPILLLIALSLVGATFTTPISASTPSGEDATDAPIKIMHIGTFTPGPLAPNQRFPQTRAAVEGAVNAINRKGGVDNHPFEVIFCDTEARTNGDADCARQAVSEGVVAVVGAVSLGADFLPILESANIPSVGTFAKTVEFTNPISFPITGGTPSLFVGSIVALADQGVEQISLVNPDLPTVRATQPATEAQVAEARPDVELDFVIIPANAGDLAPYAAEATSDSAGIAIQTGGETTTKFLQAVRQSGADSEVSSQSVTMSPDTLNALGDEAEGILVTTSFWPASDAKNNKGAMRFVRQTKSVDEDATLDDVAQNAWASVYVLRAVLTGSPDVTGTALIDQISTTDNIDLGLLPPIDFTAESPVPELPKLVNPEILYTEVKDGKLVPVTGKFVNPFVPLEKEKKE